MKEEEIMVMWRQKGCVQVTDEYLKFALEVLARHGETSLCLRGVPFSGWVISKLY